jgi:hypothetical protein
VNAVEAREERERHGRCYGELHLAIAFTVGIDAAGDAFKVAKGWAGTKPLPTGDYGAALLAGRGEYRNAVAVLRNSRLIGFDIDGEEGARLRRELVPEGLPRTVAVRSGRPGGMHLWYRPPTNGPVRHKIEFKSDGCLVASANGYLLVPPSLHASSGALYRFVNGHAPWETEIAVLPEQLLRRLVARVRSDDEAERRDDKTALEPGQRHRHLLRIGCAMRRAGAGEPAIKAALLSENMRRCNPPKDERLVIALARDIADRYPPGARGGR